MNENLKNKIVCVVGPTASGKTTFAIDYATANNGEIVSCDSMQIYKYMDIGTAKATKEERLKVPHHMIDFLEPDTDYSVADFVEGARSCIDEIISRGKLPVLCGGTGLYIDSIINNISFSAEKRDDEYRDKLWKLYEKNGVEYIHTLLEKADPIEAEKVHKNNVKRVIRALEICKTSGMTKTEADVAAQREPLYDAEIYGLITDREKLYDRINLRVDKMLKEGLVDEVRNLLEMNVPRDATSMQAIGYKEIIEYLDERCSFEDAVEKIKQESRRYAKRQITWFKRNKKIKWIEV